MSDKRVWRPRLPDTAKTAISKELESDEFFYNKYEGKAQNYLKDIIWNHIRSRHKTIKKEGSCD